MELNSLILGAILGAGVLLIAMGFGNLTNRKFDEEKRKRGFWPLNAGLILAAVSIYLFATAG